ncbi:MAG: hypothetical protein K2N25_01285 [Muribaculaceae bacterium]|nr:hypothetical protein [Muribaculaceae bacterium]
MNPIIDPNTLTEEQKRELICMHTATMICIKEAKLGSDPLQAEIFNAQKQVMEHIFGENFFKKGE